MTFKIAVFLVSSLLIIFRGPYFRPVPFHVLTLPESQLSGFVHFSIFMILGKIPFVVQSGTGPMSPDMYTYSTVFIWGQYYPGFSR